MKMRKLFAGLAAAATLFGGLAFGATTANAAEATDYDPSACTIGNTITLTGSKLQMQKASNGTFRTYTAYKLASISKDDNGVVSINTTAEAAKNAIIHIDGYDNKVDPIVWLGQNDSYTDDVVKTLAGGLANNGLTSAGTATAAVDTNDATKATATFTFTGAEGVYLIVDSGETWQDAAPDANGVYNTHNPSDPIIVGTSIATGCVPGNIANASGTVAVKPQDSKSYTTKFTKVGVNADASKLAGAEFTVYTDAEFTTEAKNFQGQTIKGTSGASGIVTLSDLKPGTYYVKETKFPVGYSESYVPQFKLEVTEDGVFKYTGLDQWKLAPRDVKTVTKA